MVFIGEMFRVIPKKDDYNNTWLSPGGALMELSGQEAPNVAIMLQRYFTAVLEAQDSGEWSKADEAIEAIKKYQAEFGATVMPASNRVDLELAFNKYKIFF